MLKLQKAKIISPSKSNKVNAILELWQSTGIKLQKLQINETQYAIWNAPFTKGSPIPLNET